MIEGAMNMLDLFGRSFVFEKYREPLRQYFLKAGFSRTPYYAFGILFFVAVAITYGLFLAFLPKLVGYGAVTKGIAALFFWLIVLSAIIFLASIAVVFVLNLKIYARVREMETYLPEYLQLVVTNLKSGMNFEQSLWSAARPEFGVLSMEITLVSKNVLTGNDTADALREFSMRYDSPTVMRSFNLIIGELRAGGRIVHVIEKIVGSLRRTTELKAEMSASVLNFIIFIAVIVCLLAPILFALANVLLSVMLGFAGLLGSSFSSGGGAAVGGAGFSEQLASIAENGPALSHNFLIFSYWAIGIIAFASSLIVSIIEKGDILGGVKYIPLFTVTAVSLFAIFNSVFSTVFASVVQF